MILDSPYISGSTTIENSLTASSAVFSGNLTITGDVSSTGGLTGSLEGTASVALNAISSSHALNADNAVSSSFAATSSFADSFTVAGEIVAQTLNVQQVTSSVVYSSGSNVFGNDVSNTQQFTGSLQVSGSSHYILGNVGVGTTSPAVELDVAGEIRSTSTSGYAALLSISALGYSILADTHTGGAMTIWTAGSEKMRIGSNGNTSITSTNENALRLINSGGQPSLIRFNDTSTTNDPYIGSYGNALAFGIYGVGESMRIDSSRNVGIGTQSPIFTDYSKLTVGNTTSDGGITIQSSPTGISRLFFAKDDTSNAEGLVRYLHSTNQMQFWAGADLRVTIPGGTGYDLAVNATSNPYTAAGRGSIYVNGTTSLYGWGVGGVAKGYMYHEGTNVYLENSVSGGAFNVVQVGAGTINFNTNGSTQAIIKSSGTKLDVYGSIGAKNSGVDGTFEDAFVGVYLSNSNEQNAIQTSVSSVASASGFRFQVSNGGGSAGRTTVVDFKRDRQIFYTNVGIGTTDPGVKLEVLETATSSGGVAVFQRNIDALNEYAHIKVGSASYPAYFGAMLGTYDIAYMSMSPDPTDGKAIVIRTVDGNVGIGTTSPASKLDVSGTTGAIFRYDSSSTYLSLLPEDADGNPKIKFGANGGAAPDLRFINDGNSEIVRFRNSGGLTFNGDTAAANALDDYEEGTWTPVLKWQDGGTYSNGPQTAGIYTKIGRVVTVSFQIQWLALVGTNGAGNLLVDGLPFSHIGSTRSAGCVGANAGGSFTFSNSGYTQWILVMDPNASFVYVIEMGNTYSHQPTVASSGIVYGFSITYQV